MGARMHLMAATWGWEYLVNPFLGVLMQSGLVPVYKRLITDLISTQLSSFPAFLRVSCDAFPAPSLNLGSGEREERRGRKKWKRGGEDKGQEMGSIDRQKGEGNKKEKKKHESRGKTLCLLLEYVHL